MSDPLHPKCNPAANPPSALPPMPEPPTPPPRDQFTIALRTAATRFGKACARGWSALDRTGRLFLVYAVGLVLLMVAMPSVVLSGLAIAGLLVFGWRARRWRALDLTGRSLVVCGNLASMVALSLAIGGSSHKPGDETPMPNTTSTASDKGARRTRRLRRPLRTSGTQ